MQWLLLPARCTGLYYHLPVSTISVMSDEVPLVVGNNKGDGRGNFEVAVDGSS